MCVCVMSLNCDVCLQCSEVDKVRDDPPKGTIMIAHCRGLMIIMCYCSKEAQTETETHRITASGGAEVRPS